MEFHRNTLGRFTLLRVYLYRCLRLQLATHLSGVSVETLVFQNDLRDDLNAFEEVLIFGCKRSHLRSLLLPLQTVLPRIASRDVWLLPDRARCSSSLVLRGGCVSVCARCGDCIAASNVRGASAAHNFSSRSVGNEAGCDCPERLLL